jgi:intracellular sulfur oxidation DsrE/DsrF family protein
MEARVAGVVVIVVVHQLPPVPVQERRAKEPTEVAFLKPATVEVVVVAPQIQAFLDPEAVAATEFNGLNKDILVVVVAEAARTMHNIHEEDLADVAVVVAEALQRESQRQHPVLQEQVEAVELTGDMEEPPT